MSLPSNVELGVAETVIYTVPFGMVAEIKTIHASNTSGAARTFTVSVKTLGLTVPISPLNQALALDEIAIAADPLRLTEGCSLVGYASGASVLCLVTGTETVIT